MSVRLQNVTTGVIVSVSEETAANLGSDWREPKAAAPRSETPDASWKVAELKAHAEDNGIDLEDATKKEDILAAIVAASNPE